jgi:hypothetical protein
MRQFLVEAQTGLSAVKPAARRGRPPGSANQRPQLVNGWPADPEARRLEMKRRMAVARGKKAEPKVPTNEHGHVIHDVALSRQRKAAWAALSPKKRRERLAKMAAGRLARTQKTVREAKEEAVA